MKLGDSEDDLADDNEDESTGSSGSENDDVEIDIDAIGLELGESLWAGIAQAYSSSDQSAVSSKPEQKLIPTIQRILTYLPLDQEIEAIFKGSALHSGGEASEGRDVLSALRSLANTGVVDNETASALAKSIEEIAEYPIFLSEQTGIKRKRAFTDDGVQVKEEDE
jgi:hypothetical protein